MIAAVVSGSKNYLLEETMNWAERKSISRDDWLFPLSDELDIGLRLLHSDREKCGAQLRFRDESARLPVDGEGYHGLSRHGWERSRPEYGHSPERDGP